MHLCNTPCMWDSRNNLSEPLCGQGQLENDNIPSTIEVSSTEVLPVEFVKHLNLVSNLLDVDQRICRDLVNVSKNSQPALSFRLEQTHASKTFLILVAMAGE
jgi:hypothetical protein